MEIIGTSTIWSKNQLKVKFRLYDFGTISLSKIGKQRGSKNFSFHKI